jgi:putative leucine rich repeat-containing domain protein
MSEEQRKAMRMDYDTKFLSKDAREDLSGILRKGINDNPKMKPIKSSRISTKDVQFGVLTNGITGVSKAIMRLTKLEQFFIANSPIRSDGFFVEVKPDSPYYEEQDEWKWEDMTTLTDIEIYNCPNLETLPVKMLKNLPELVSLNVARNPGIYAEDRDVLKENWEEIIGDDSKCADKIQLLYLGYNKLKGFPEYELLKKMKKLSLLDCTNNEIETLHPFGKEVKLMKVYLDNNKITAIPSVEENGLKYFFGWNDVENFSCSNNLLTEVPNIFNAKSDFVMGTVDFSNNLIDKFEDGEDHRGINASTVNLHHNKFKVFPKLLFEKESPMQTLNLSANGMTTIPKGALKGKTSLEYLTSLDLTYNKLSSLTDDFYVINMPVLYGLDLSYNQFSKFPTQPLSINYLVVFGIRHQRDDNGNRTLREWPTGLYKNPSLKAFYIGSNDLRKIDDTISPTILMFEIKDNPNISIDISDVCPYIKAGRYTLVYDKSQDIRGCDALDLGK